jgi:hypothetical protein
VIRLVQICLAPPIGATNSFPIVDKLSIVNNSGKRTKLK